MKKGIIIIGMGKGLSLGIAKKFGKEGYEVGMISRNEGNLKAYQSALALENITSFYAAADVSSELKTKTVFIRTGDQFIEQDFYQFDPYLNSIKPK